MQSTHLPKSSLPQHAKEQPSPPAKVQPTHLPKSSLPPPTREQVTQYAEEQPIPPAKEQSTQPAKEQPTPPAKVQPTLSYNEQQTDSLQPILSAPAQDALPAKVQPLPPAKVQPNPPAKAQSTHPDIEHTTTTRTVDKNPQWRLNDNTTQDKPNMETMKKENPNPKTKEVTLKNGNEKKRKRIRKNKEITVVAINVRGLKGKIKSLQSLLQAEKVDIALITETKMKTGDQISIKRYRWVGKNRTNNNGGGVGILISERIARNATEDNSGEEHERLETKWIRIECRPRNIAIGVFYGPQESEKGEKGKEIYAALNRQIEQKINECDIILAGDFNAKLAVSKATCTQIESRNGKMLQEMISEYNLLPANLNADHGIWTRTNRKIKTERSVIDYIMVSPRITTGITTMIVDEEGHLRVRGKNETDHNTLLMTLKINDTRKPTYINKWNLDNNEGWKAFNNKVAEAANQHHITLGTYHEAIKE